MKTMQVFAESDRVTNTDLFGAFSGKDGVEFDCTETDLRGGNDVCAAIALDREDAIRLARWILEVCEVAP